MSARRIKVLHVITRLIVGGAQETAMLLCQHLDPTRYDWTFMDMNGNTLDRGQAPCH